MRLLCLDLATRLGWACGSHDDSPVSHGVVNLPPHDGRDRGRFLWIFGKWLDTAIKTMEPTDILFEAPILSKKTTLAAVSKLVQLAGVAEMVAYEHKLNCTEADLGSIRQYFIGMRKAPDHVIGSTDRRKWLKKKIVNECRKRGFNVADDNDADALALLAYGLALRKRGFCLHGEGMELIHG